MEMRAVNECAIKSCVYSNHACHAPRSFRMRGDGALMHDPQPPACRDVHRTVER